MPYLWYLPWPHGGSNFEKKPMASTAKMEQWSVSFLPLRKQGAVHNRPAMCWDWNLRIKCFFNWIARGESWIIETIEELKGLDFTTLKLLLVCETIG